MSKVCAFIACPYYKRETPQKIICEGATKDCSTHVAFQDEKKRKEYKSRLCEKDWEQCLYAQMLNRKWEYE